MVDTGETVEAKAADNVLLNGVLASGALLSFQIAAVPFNATGWRMAVYGSKGTIIASTPVMPQITPITLVGAQGSEPLTELSVPQRLRVVPEAVPMGPPQNIGQLYVRMAEAIHDGEHFAPNFDDALEVYKLLEAIQRSSDEGRVVRLG
jgi:predicted dehydrogenase